MGLALSGTSARDSALNVTVPGAILVEADGVGFLGFENNRRIG